MSEISIGKIKFSSCIFNASGALDVTLEELKIIGESKSSAILMKSCTVEEREGNVEPRYAKLPHGSIQSMGLPNLGYLAYIDFASKLKEYNKPIIASVAGLCESDYVKMVKAFQESEVDLIEVNLSCPNIAGKSQVAYDFEQTENVLKNIVRLGEKPIGLKLPAYYDPTHHKQMADLIKKYKISFITCINSIGNTLFIENGKPIIAPNNGLGGLGGKYIKPIALANVKLFRDLLPKEVKIIGVGGIESGKDVLEYLSVGADLVQVGTTFMEEGVECFERIEKELYL